MGVQQSATVLRVAEDDVTHADQLLQSLQSAVKLQEQAAERAAEIVLNGPAVAAKARAAEQVAEATKVEAVAVVEATQQQLTLVPLRLRSAEASRTDANERLVAWDSRAQQRKANIAMLRSVPQADASAGRAAGHERSTQSCPQTRADLSLPRTSFASLCV